MTQPLNSPEIPLHATMAEALVAASSESQVAGRIGVTRKSVSNWRKGGTISEPNLKALKRLFQELQDKSAGASKVIALPDRASCDLSRTAVAVSVAPPPATSRALGVQERYLREKTRRKEVEVEQLEELVAANPGAKVPRNLKAAQIALGMVEVFITAAGLLNVYGESIVTAVVVGAFVAAFLIITTAELGCWLATTGIGSQPWAGWMWGAVQIAGVVALVSLLMRTRYGSGLVDTATADAPVGLDQMLALLAATAQPGGDVLFPFYCLGLLFTTVISIRLSYLNAGPAAHLKRARKQLMELEMQAEKGAKS